MRRNQLEGFTCQQRAFSVLFYTQFYFYTHGQFYADVAVIIIKIKLARSCF